MSDEAVKILLSIALAIISGGVSIATLYIKQKYSTERLKSIAAKVKAAVQAAEIIGASLGWDGAAKKAWVLERLSDLTGISEEQLEVFIESAVAELKYMGEELVGVQDVGVLLKSDVPIPIPEES